MAAPRRAALALDRSRARARGYGKIRLAVALLALPILVSTLWVMRSGAPAKPAIAGGVAGLLAGGLTAVLYVLHCPEDSLLFTTAWHVPAVAAVSILGAVIGNRLLRW